jgi:hypothetical protein
MYVLEYSTVLPSRILILLFNGQIIQLAPCLQWPLQATVTTNIIQVISAAAAAAAATVVIAVIASFDCDPFAQARVDR